MQFIPNQWCLNFYNLHQRLGLPTAVRFFMSGVGFRNGAPRCNSDNMTRKFCASQSVCTKHSRPHARRFLNIQMKYAEKIEIYPEALDEKQRKAWNRKRVGQALHDLWYHPWVGGLGRCSQTSQEMTNEITYRFLTICFGLRNLCFFVISGRIVVVSRLLTCFHANPTNFLIKSKFILRIPVSVVFLLFIAYKYFMSAFQVTRTSVQWKSVQYCIAIGNGWLDNVQRLKWPLGWLDNSQLF